MVEPYAKKENKAIIWDIRTNSAVVILFGFQTHRFMLNTM